MALPQGSPARWRVRAGERLSADSAPVLYVFAGLPGSGKSTLATHLAQVFAAVYLRIDTIEQALRDLCALTVTGEGYRLAYRLAADNLALGCSVVADACNPITLTRDEWHAVARAAGVRCVDIEVVCSDPVEHRQRVDTRTATVPGLLLPGWEEVQAREYHPWATPHLRIDTAGRTVDESVAELLQCLATGAAHE